MNTICAIDVIFAVIITFIITTLYFLFKYEKYMKKNWWEGLKISKEKK